MNGTIFEVIVVGAGPSGLMCSYYLKHLGLEHIIFDQGRLSESWRSQRWNNFRMITPFRSSLLPGSLLKSRRPDAYGTAKEMVALFQEYASSFQLPITEQAQVISIEKSPNSPVFQVKVLHDSEVERTYDAWQVIIAAGSSNRPYIPRIASTLDPCICQIHASQYTSEDRLKPGAVLVVGGGQSGMEIAQDLISQNRKVWLSAKPHPQLPRQYRGREIFQWLAETRLADSLDMNAQRQKTPLITYEIDEDASLTRVSLASRGVRLLGALKEVNGVSVTFAAWSAEDVSRATEASSLWLQRIDQYIQSEKIGSSAESLIADDESLPTASTLNLADEGVNTIIWATGYDSSFPAIQCPLGAEQLTNQTKGLTGVEGLYVVGARQSAGSDYVVSAKDEASFVTNHIYGILR
jgi:putative flavoprotein involved in K+ transport